MKIAIIGLGFHGFPLALQFTRNGGEVIGLVIDPKKIVALNRKQPYIKRIKTAEVKQQVRAERFPSSDFANLRAVMIPVPTPLNKNREPDISYLRTGEAMAPVIVDTRNAMGRIKTRSKQVWKA